MLFLLSLEYFGKLFFGGRFVLYEISLRLKSGERFVLRIIHSAMFTDKEGKLRIVFHAHKDKSNIHPRAMYIGTVNFENVNGTDRMRISKEYITPKLLQ